MPQLQCTGNDLLHPINAVDDSWIRDVDEYIVHCQQIMKINNVNNIIEDDLYNLIFYSRSRGKTAIKDDEALPERWIWKLNNKLKFLPATIINNPQVMPPFFNFKRSCCVKLENQCNVPHLKTSLNGSITVNPNSKFKYNNRGKLVEFELFPPFIATYINSMGHNTPEFSQSKIVFFEIGRFERGSSSNFIIRERLENALNMALAFMNDGNIQIANDSLCNMLNRYSFLYDTVFNINNKSLIVDFKRMKVMLKDILTDNKYKVKGYFDNYISEVEKDFKSYLAVAHTKSEMMYMTIARIFSNKCGEILGDVCSYWDVNDDIIDKQLGNMKKKIIKPLLDNILDTTYSSTDVKRLVVDFENLLSKVVKY